MPPNTLFVCVYATKHTICIRSTSTIMDKNGRDLVDAEEFKKRWKEYMGKLYKKILMNQITKMVWSVTQSQTLWSVKSSGP